MYIYICTFNIYINTYIHVHLWAPPASFLVLGRIWCGLHPNKGGENKKQKTTFWVGWWGLPHHYFYGPDLHYCWNCRD